jgi:hypothetical protein
MCDDADLSMDDNFVDVQFGADAFDINFVLDHVMIGQNKIRWEL